MSIYLFELQVVDLKSATKYYVSLGLDIISQNSEVVEFMLPDGFKKLQLTCDIYHKPSSWPVFYISSQYIEIDKSKIMNLLEDPSGNLIGVYNSDKYLFHFENQA